MPELNIEGMIAGPEIQKTHVAAYVLNLCRMYLQEVNNKKTSKNNGLVGSSWYLCHCFNSEAASSCITHIAKNRNYYRKDKTLNIWTNKTMDIKRRTLVMESVQISTQKYGLYFTYISTKCN